MIKRILINHPEKKAQKDHLQNARQKLEGKTFISDQEIDDLIDNALKDSLNQTQLHK